MRVRVSALSGRTAAPGQLAPGLLLALCLAAGPAGADALRGTVVLTSDYVERGISQTNGQAALQGSLAYWHPSGWYAGAWASNVETAHRYVTAPGRLTEVNLFLGYGTRLSPDWFVDAKAVRYLYPDDPAPVGYDYNEFSVGVAWRERLYANLSVAPGTTVFARTGGVRDHTSMAAELSFQQPLSPWFTWMLGGGYNEVAYPPVAGYYFGATGLTLQLHQVSFELMHFRTSSAGIDLFGRQLAGARTVLTVSVTF